MRNECDIIGDVLPLYFEGMASEDTREFVEEHLKNCEGCRAKIDSMKQNVGGQPPKDPDPDRGFIRFMKRLKRSGRIIGTVLLTLLVLANSFFIYLLVDLYQFESQKPDPFYEWHQRRQVLLRYSPDSHADHEQLKLLVTLTLKDYPNILRDEPIILIANPDLKPLVAEILEEEPSILEEDPLILYRYPELMEMNPALKPILEDILEKPNNSYAKVWFSNQQKRNNEITQ